MGSPKQTWVALVVTLQLCALVCCQQTCSSLSSCSQCLTAPSCVWCSTPASAGCLSRDNAHTCINVTYIVDPKATIAVETLTLDENHQVSVRSAQMKLRVGEPQSFSVSVKSARNFPLDLYMLMDLSASFESDLVTVKSISSDIVSAVGNLTSRSQVGFGTFVDKPTAPFNSPLALRLAYMFNGKPSACSGMSCSRPVSYEHVVNLTNSTDLFSESVQDLLISTSSDDAEGTLDAMMQAVVCTDTVGWREEARKVLLVMTDDLMHTAGDGRLAAIYRPNDARCHTQYDPTENKTLYMASLEYDYPTVEQVRMVMEQFGVVPVFATSALPTYFSNVIAAMLGGFADKLTTNSDNIVDVIAEANRQIESRVSINYEQHEAISLSIIPICPNGSNLVEEKSQCVNVSGQTVEFNITVTLTSCTEKMKIGQMETIRGYVPGFGQFILAVGGICSCDCDNDTEPFSSACSGNGNLTCGQCTCSDGWSGNDCSCSTGFCDKGLNNQECSGRGSCVCGQCVCNQPNTTYSGVSTPSIFGKTCECDNFLCDTGVNGAVCSGQGTCTCNNGEYSCSCFYSTITGRQHEGTACQCSYDNCVDPMDSCRDSNNMSCLVCSGRGSCNPCAPTGSCRCDGDITTTSYCIPIGPVTQASCDADTSCVLCLAKQQQCSRPLCTNYLTIDVPPPEGYQIPGSTEGSTNKCSDIRDDQCTYDYYIAYSNNGSTLVVVGPPSCLLLPPWAIAVVTLAGVILIGVILFIVVKLCLVWLDYRELKRFEKEVKEADFSKNVNPMFQAPTVTYKNVAYGVTQ